MPTVHYYPRKFFRLRGVAPPMRLAPRPGRAPRGWNGAYPLLRPEGGAGVTPSPAGKKRARADAPTEEADEEVDASGAGELQSGHFPATRGAVPRRRREKMRRLLSDTAAARAPLEGADQSLDEPCHEGMEPGQHRADTLDGQPIDSDEGDREVVTGQEEAAEEAASEADGTSADQGEGGENVPPQEPSAANSHGHGSVRVQRVERVVNLRGRPRPDGHWGYAAILSQEEWEAPIGSLEEEVEKDLGLGDLDPALVLQRKLDRELGVGDYDPRRLFQRELERDLGVPVGGIVGTSAQVARPELRRFITPDPSRSPSKRGPPVAALEVAGDAGGTAHAQALAVGFSAHLLQNKTKEEVQLLLDSAASMREKTREETGLCAPRSLASVLEQALEVGFDVRFLASKSLDEAKALILYAASAATPLRRNSSLPGLGEAEKSPADVSVPKNVGVSGPLMPDEANYSHFVNPSEDGIVSSHERALNMGFTTEFLATKTKAEAKVLLDSIASISLRTKQVSGHSAFLNLASTVEYALELGYALCFLANQSEEEIEQYVTSRVEKIEAERAIASNGANVTFSDRESDVDDDEELNADDEDSDAGESDAENEAEAEVQSDTSDEGSVQDEEDEEDSQSDRVVEDDISSDGMESSEEEDMISIVSSGEEQSMSGESAVADESSEDESDDGNGVVRFGLPLGMRRSSSLSSLTRGRTAPSSAKASRFRSWMGRKQTIPVQPKSKKHRAANEEIFRQHVEALKVYREQYGDYLVPSTYPILGGWVRMVRACYHDPGAKRSGRLTEERREMLDEIDFQWERPASGSHAYRIRARNITRAAVTMQSINDYNASLQQPIAPVEGSDPKATVAKQIAEHVINTEQHDQARQIDEKFYARGVAAGVEEVDLFNAFEEIGREGSLSLSPENQGVQDRKRKWSSTAEDATIENGPALVRRPRQPDEVFGEWLADRKQNWRQQQLRQWKTKIASAEGGASLSTRPESIEEFGHWLAVRKAIWKEKQRRKLRMVEDLVVDIADKRPPVVKKKAKRARKSSSSPEIDYGTCGVRYNPSGMWAVEVSVRSKLRYVGRFPSQAAASTANRVFRERIAAIVTPDQMADEVNEAVKLARWSALQAVSRASSENSQSTPKKDERAPPVPRRALEDKGLGQSQELSPSAQELTDYMINWLGQPGHTLMPSLDQKKLIMQEVGVTQARLEGWLYRTRKRSESRGNGANGEESVVTKPLAPRQMTQPVAPGISQRSSGNWEVAPYFHGKKRYIGTFACPAQAKNANEIAREHLTMGDGPRPSDEEIEQAVKKARDAVRQKEFSAQQKMQTVAPKAVSRKRESTSSSSVGVRQARSGRWEAGFRYGGIGRLQIGTFETKDEATLASTVARGILLKDSNDRNVSLAREKAHEAVRKLNDEDDDPPTEEEELAILLRWDESGAWSGPHLDQLQSEEGFVEWLAMRKESWRRQSGRVLKPRPNATDPKIQRKSTTTSSEANGEESTVSKSLAGNKSSHIMSLPGISQRTRGKWEVAPFLYGKKRYIGSFDSLSQARKANEIVREQLVTAGDGPKPSNEEIEQAVKTARDAARKLNVEDDEPPTEEDKLAILLKWDESGAWSGPHLPFSQLQSQEGFLRWLAIRKESWRRQSGRVLKPHTTKPRPEEHRCSYNCGAPFDLAPKECCTLNCSGLVHQICQQFYLRSHGKQVGVDDELRCKECSVWTESESQSKHGDATGDEEPTSPLLVLGANLPAGPAINDANTVNATTPDLEDSRAMRADKARAARRRRRLQLIARAAVADSRRATFARGRQVLAEEFTRTFRPAAFVEATFEPAFAMLLEASEVEAGKAQESPVP